MSTLTPTAEETRAASSARCAAHTPAPAVVSAARSPLLWTLGSLGAMAHFGINHAGYKLAQHIAMRTRPGDVAKAMREREVAQLRAKVIRAESRYPLIHRKLTHRSESYAEVAKGYVSAGGRGGEPLTRMRAHQILRQFDEYARAAGAPRDRDRVLRDIERAGAHEVRAD